MPPAGGAGKRKGHLTCCPSSAGKTPSGQPATRAWKVIGLPEWGRTWGSFWRTDELNLWCYVNMKA